MYKYGILQKSIYHRSEVLIHIEKYKSIFFHNLVLYSLPIMIDGRVFLGLAMLTLAKISSWTFVVTFLKHFIKIKTAKIICRILVTNSFCQVDKIKIDIQIILFLSKLL